jgi:predicted transcriptional regulator
MTPDERLTAALDEMARAMVSLGEAVTMRLLRDVERTTGMLRALDEALRDAEVPR